MIPRYINRRAIGHAKSGSKGDSSISAAYKVINDLIAGSVIRQKIDI
jgi:hypothetical protein